MGICLSRHRRRRRSSEAAMANTISNLKMTNPIKGIVSKHRKRYTKDGFNLDLAYITDRLIAMGYPAEKLEGVYRNHIDDVYKFLEQKHKDHYKIYNLCSERSYETAKFHERVSTYAFEDHNPPKIELIQPFCEDVHQWLSEDSKNVAAVHCKAGKGRTGTMVCCYLLHSGQFNTAEDALSFYGQKRAHDKKGVTIPSQRRYVQYYAALIGSRLQYRANTVQIRTLTMQPPPSLNGQCTLELCVTQADSSQKITCGCQEVRKGESLITITLDKCAPLTGDVKVEVYNKPKMMRKDKLYHFWFNTFFVAQEVAAVKADPLDDSSEMQTFKLCLDKWQLDDAHKDKQHKLYSSDFKVELIVQQIPESSAWSRHGRAGSHSAPSPTNSPAASTSSNSSLDDEPYNEPDDETWDSGEHSYPPLNGHPARHRSDARPVTYPTRRADYAGFRIGPYSHSLLEMSDSTRSSAVTSATDLSQPCADDKAVESKIPKVSSDHTISSGDRKPADAHHGKGRKYLFFQSGKKENSSQEEDEGREEPLRSPSASERRMSAEAGYSKPRLSLGDVRASWREFSGKHFGTDHSKHKKKPLGERTAESELE